MGCRRDGRRARGRARAEREAVVVDTSPPVAAYARAGGDLAGWLVRRGGNVEVGVYGSRDPVLHGFLATAHAEVTGRPRPRACRASGSHRGCPPPAPLTLRSDPGDVRLPPASYWALDVDGLVTFTESLVLALVRACTSAS